MVNCKMNVMFGLVKLMDSPKIIPNAWAEVRDEVTLRLTPDVLYKEYFEEIRTRASCRHPILHRHFKNSKNFENEKAKIGKTRKIK